MRAVGHDMMVSSWLSHSAPNLLVPVIVFSAPEVGRLPDEVGAHPATLAPNRPTPASVSKLRREIEKSPMRAPFGISDFTHYGQHAPPTPSPSRGAPSTRAHRARVRLRHASEPAHPLLDAAGVDR